MSEVQKVNFEGIADVQIEDRDGALWFVAKDICKALGFTRTSDATRYLDEDEKGALILRTLGGRQTVTTISESGLYNLIMRSSKPNAKLMRRWVTSAVLPSIRKHGGYIAGQELLPSDLQAKTVAVIEEEAEAVNRQMQLLREDRDEAYKGLRQLSSAFSSRKRRKRPRTPTLRQVE